MILDGRDHFYLIEWESADYVWPHWWWKKRNTVFSSLSRSMISAEGGKEKGNQLSPLLHRSLSPHLSSSSSSCSNEKKTQAGPLSGRGISKGEWLWGPLFLLAVPQRRGGGMGWGRGIGWWWCWIWRMELELLRGEEACCCGRKSLSLSLCAKEINSLFFQSFC